MKQERVAHLDSTVCYLKKENEVLMIRFSKKWGQIYAPPGGKFVINFKCEALKYEISEM